MLSIIADMLLTASRTNGPKGFPDHLRESADRYVRSPRSERHYRADKERLRGGNLW
jgi:hypothetical protein